MMTYSCEIPIGTKFGRLSFEGLSHRCEKSKQWYWKCRCDCGNESVVMSGNVRAGRSNSCGCLQKELAGSYNRSHGMSGKRIHVIWKNMRQRCLNPKNPRYIDYGGRGVKICESWLESFESFYKDVGNPPSELHSLDRIDNDGNYEKSNVRWATNPEQSGNRRVSVMVGDKTLKAFCKSEGVSYYRAYDLIVRKKISPPDALKILKGL